MGSPGFTPPGEPLLRTAEVLQSRSRHLTEHYTWACFEKAIDDMSAQGNALHHGYGRRRCLYLASTTFFRHRCRRDRHELLRAIADASQVARATLLKRRCCRHDRHELMCAIADACRTLHGQNFSFIAGVGVTIMSSCARSLMRRKLHARHFCCVADAGVTFMSSCARSLMRRKAHARHF